MSQKNALARLSDVTENGVLPFVRRLSRRVRQTADDVALRVLGSDFEQRVTILRARYAESGDPFGIDLDTAEQAAKVLALFHRVYFRTQCEGIDHIPAGRALLVANHAGQIPVDAAIIAAATFLDAIPPRVTRAMVDKWAFSLPFVSAFFSRVGQVVGVPDNARRLLEMGELCLAFPEGMRGISKPYQHRYELQPFGLGFMRLALQTRTPIVPVAVIGAEEQYPSFGNLEWAARALGLPTFPLIPQLLVPGGQLPLPTKYRLYFGEPLSFSGDPDEDDPAVEERVWVVRQAIQLMVNRGIAARKHVFF